MRFILVFALLALSGCATSVCVDNLNISDEQFIPFVERPQLQRSAVIFDRTISHNQEPFVLKAYQLSNEIYYLEFYPARAQSRMYGPFNGSFSEHVQCS